MPTEKDDETPIFLKVKNKRDELEKNERGGVKDDSGKLELSLLPWDSLEEITKILMLGAKKYSADNWKRVEPVRYVDALYRHLSAFMRGEALDPESGISHLAHAGCNLLFMISLYGDSAFHRDE